MLFVVCFDLDPHPHALAERHLGQLRARLERPTDFTHVNIDNQDKKRHSNSYRSRFCPWGARRAAGKHAGTRAGR